MWVIVTLASLVVLVILILCVPLDMAFHADMYGKPKFRLRLSWFFGLMGKEITRGKKPKEKNKVVKDKRRPRDRKTRGWYILQILRTKGLLRQARDLLRDILSGFKIRELTADYRVGLDNPADTGLLFAIIGPATFLLNSSLPHQIRVHPSFADESVFEGYSYGVVRLQPIHLVMAFLRFAFSLAAIRVVKRLVLTKWKRKE